jgi:hypothetical protein
MASMSNREIILAECAMCGFEWNGNNLYTFAEWQERGYKIIKGSKAVITTSLWKPVTKTNKETGKTETHFISVKANLFSREQVEEMSEEFKNYISEKKESKATSTTAKKTSNKKEKKNFINVTKQVVV